MNPKLTFCTVIDRTGVAQAQRLRETLSRRPAGGVLHVLLHEPPVIVPQLREQLGELARGLAEIGDPNWTRTAFSYESTKLIEATLPHFIRFLFEQGAERVVYLPANGIVSEGIDKIEAALGRHDCVLTGSPTESAIEALPFGLRKSRATVKALSLWEERASLPRFAYEPFDAEREWTHLIPTMQTVKLAEATQIPTGEAKRPVTGSVASFSQFWDGSAIDTEHRRKYRALSQLERNQLGNPFNARPYLDGLTPLSLDQAAAPQSLTARIKEWSKIHPFVERGARGVWRELKKLKPA